MACHSMGLADLAEVGLGGGIGAFFRPATFLIHRAGMARRLGNTIRQPHNWGQACKHAFRVPRTRFFESLAVRAVGGLSQSR